MNLDEEERRLEQRDSMNGVHWFEWYVIFAFCFCAVMLGVALWDLLR